MMFYRCYMFCCTYDYFLYATFMVVLFVLPRANVAGFDLVSDNFTMRRNCVQRLFRCSLLSFEQLEFGTISVIF